MIANSLMNNQLITSLNQSRRSASNTAMKKILFLSSVFPDATQATKGTYNYEMCKALAKNHDVRIISPRSFIDHFQKCCPRWTPSVDTVSANLNCSYPVNYYIPGIKREQFGSWMWWSIQKNLQQTLHNWKPDLILTYWAHPEGQVGYMLGQETGAASAVIIGGSDVLVLPKDPKRKKVIEQVMRNNSHIITVSDGLKNACVNLGATPEHVHTIKQGIDTNRFSKHDKYSRKLELGIDPNVPVLLWVGRIVEIKDLPTLFTAVGLLHEKGTKVQLLIAGDGPFVPTMKILMTQLNLGDYVKFLGPLSHDQLPKYYQAADLCVLSSVSEGLPNVLREALACGTPFVSTDVGSIREIYQPEYSVLVPVKNPVAFAEGIKQALSPSYQQAAASYAPRTWDEMAADIVKLIP